MRSAAVSRVCDAVSSMFLGTIEFGALPEWAKACNNPTFENQNRGKPVVLH